MHTGDHAEAPASDLTKDLIREGLGQSRRFATDLMTLTVEPAQFWFVWTKRGRIPRFAHDTFQAAEAEAARLAKLHPGRKFIVLQAIEKVVAAPALSVVEAELERAVSPQAA